MPDDRYRSSSFARINLFLLGFIALLLAGAALKLTSSVVLPFIIAVLLTFVLEPIIVVLEKIRIPRAIGAVVVVLLVAAAVYVVGFILAQSLKTIMSLYPKYEKRFTELYMLLAKAFSLPYDSHQSLFQNLWGQLGVRARVQAFALTTSESFLGFLTDTIMVILFVVFLLLEIGHFRKRIELAFAGFMSTRIQRIVADVIKQVARYLSAKFFISLATGILVGGLLGWIGLDFPIVWGVIAFILNFIPNIGSIFGGVAVTVFALVQFWPLPGPIIATASTMIGVNMLLGNIIEPRVQGQNLGLSPFVILVSLSAWGWLWGFAGLVLAVPMTVIVKIVCENVPGLESISIMMGSYKDVKQKSQD
ncbi:MAG: AI-2E family transporter [Spirochaetes bacterium]|nr:AI-2E family transporter [Spirochaetota bacterium]